MAEAGLVVLDAGQFSIRCRSCRWRSPRCTALPEAWSAFGTHACLGQIRSPTTPVMSALGALCCCG
jgi:hypothetical protein